MDFDGKLIFIWIPKNAGTSFFKMMQPKGMVQFIHYPQDFKVNLNDYPMKTFGHIDTRCLIKDGFLTKNDWESSKKVCIVRNPYTRFVSLYSDFIRSKRFQGSIHEFANVIMHTTCKIGSYNVMDYSQCAKQVDWILPGVDILRFEDLKGMPHENAGKQIELPHHVKKMVEDIYIDDFVLLGY